MQPRKKNIYLCGMIGSGKTSIGKHLAHELRLAFYDLDQEMDRILGHSFHKLVQEKGWLAFRELEYSICKRFSRLECAVVSLGGGTVRYEWNRDVLGGSGLVILLTASLQELARRVRAADRPRVNPGTSLEEDLQEIWEASSQTYYAAADVVYDTDQKSIGQSVAELKVIVVDSLGQRA